jgi:predicted choloylglycine hydrolase
MNEKGLVVGMAAVPDGNMRPDPNKQTVDQLVIIREILDHAATVDEAVELLVRYNIDMSEVPIHYLIASAAGDSALVEFYRGEMQVFRNKVAWQQATNFLVAATDGNTKGQCPRYDRIGQGLSSVEGRLSAQDALDLLAQVSQEGTQWSVVYNLTSGEIQIVMGRGYQGPIHTLHLEQVR